jgi:hypothetical protein
MRVSFLFYYYTKSRALPNSITIAFSTPKLAKPPALLPPPPHLAQSFLDPGTEGFRASRSKNQNLGSGKRGGAVTGSRRRRRKCAAFAAPGASYPRSEPEPARLRGGGGASDLAATSSGTTVPSSGGRAGRSDRRRRRRGGSCCCF